MADIKDLHSISQDLKRRLQHCAGASAKMAFSHHLMMQCSKNPLIPNDRLLSIEYITTFVLCESHLRGGIFSFEK